MLPMPPPHPHSAGTQRDKRGNDFGASYSSHPPPPKFILREEKMTSEREAPRHLKPLMTHLSFQRNVRVWEHDRRKQLRARSVWERDTCQGCANSPLKGSFCKALQGGGREQRNSGIFPQEKWKKRRIETTETCRITCRCLWITDFNYKPQTDAAETTLLNFFRVTSGAKP